MTADLTVRDEGTILLFTGTTDVGAAWIDEHLDREALRWGNSTTVVEHRYAQDIIDGAMADGLTVTVEGR